MGFAPLPRRLEGAAPDAMLGGFGRFLVRLVGIAGRSAEIDGVTLGHESLAEIGHALRATQGNDAAVAILALLHALHIAAFDQRGEFCLGGAAAGPGFAIGLLAGLMQ